MKLQSSHSDINLPFLELVWILAALIIFSTNRLSGGSIAAGLALLALSFLQRWVLIGRPSRRTVFDGPWGLLLTGAIVSMAASYDISLSLPVLLILAGNIALYYTAANARKTTVLVKVALLAGLAVAVYFLTQYQYIPHAEKSDLASSLGRLTSGPFPRLGSWEPFSNSVATLLEGLIPLGIALTLSDHSRGSRAMAGIGTGIMGLAVVVTASRGAWVALLSAGAIGLASRWRKGVAALAAVTFAALVALGINLILTEGATLDHIPVVGPVLYQLFARPDRLEVYHGSLRLIQDFPLTGIGLGDVFGMVYSKYVLLVRHVFLTYPHNLYLAVWLGHGLLGILGMGWLVVVFGRLVAWEQRAGHPAPLFQAAWIGIIAVLVHGLFDARQYVDLWTMWPLSVLLGLVVSTSTTKAEKRGQKMTLPRKRKWIALALVAAGCVVVWPSLTAATLANVGAAKQAKAELTEDLSEDTKDSYLQGAIVSYNRALQAEPDNRTAHLRLGNLAVAAGQYEEGIAHLEVAWQASPKDPTARKALGLAYAWVGEIDRAADLLQGTRNIVAELNTWGGWHRREGRQEVAANAYRTSLALEPDQSQVQELLTVLESK